VCNYASPNICIKECKFGRGVFAAKDVRKGETLMVDKALAHSINDYMKKGEVDTNKAPDTSMTAVNKRGKVLMIQRCL